MSENKAFIIKKTTPGSVLFNLSPMSNPSVKRRIFLTKRLPQQTLPLDWALGIFLNSEVFNMYKQGLFTFNDNDAIMQAAVEAGVYFGDLDFTPRKEDPTPVVLKALRSGVRGDILKVIKEYGDDFVKGVVVENADSLTSGVVSMLENHWKIQLTLDGGN
jgi:hypothetical protein